MSTNSEATITFHGSTFVELAYQQTTLFVDPVFSSTRRGRRLRGATRPCDYVFLTRTGDNLDDTLDLLEDSREAVLVGDERTCRTVQSELGLNRQRLLDLEPWERASESSFRVTALPIATPSMLDESVSLLEDLGSSGLGRLLPRGAGRMPMRGLSSGMRTLQSLPFFGNEMMRGLRGRPGLGFLFELTQGPRVLHLADGVHEAADERELEDIASLGRVDVALLDVGNQAVDAVVRAVRLLDVSTVLLYRSVDPYARGRRAQATPVGAFLEALREDAGDELEALHLREGDRFVLGTSDERKPDERKPSAARPAQA